MGHDKSIHLKIYRQPIDTKDILNVSQRLEKAQGTFIEHGKDDVVYEEDSSDNEEILTPVKFGNIIVRNHE